MCGQLTASEIGDVEKMRMRKGARGGKMTEIRIVYEETASPSKHRI